MRRHEFAEMGMEPSDVYSHIKTLLTSEGFLPSSEEVRENFWDLHARKSGIKRMVLGEAMDVDVLVAGTKAKFEVQLHLGVWGRDLVVPAIESVATVGVAGVEELRSAQKVEEMLWEQIVHKIDPSLKICQQDGLLFKSEQELRNHLQMDDEEQHKERDSFWNQALPMIMGSAVTAGD